MSDWTVDTLKEHFDTVLDQRFKAQEEAIRKAAEDIDLRDIKNNEFRGQLADQAATLMPRAEANQAFKTLEDKIASKNIQVVLSLGVGFVAVIIAVFNFASAQ